jgi:outer membrane protein assembly factor BamB
MANWKQGLAAALLASLTAGSTPILLRAVDPATPTPGDLARFLPPDGNNVYPATGLFHTWPAGGPKELWRQTIGGGKSSIVERQGKLFTMAQLEKKQYALCLDASTGKELWRQLLVSTDNHHNVNGPVSSPVLDGERVFFFPYVNNNGDIYALRCPCICLKAADGALVWREDKEFYCSEGTTPLLLGDTLYIGGGSKENVLIAADKNTGKLLGQTPEDRDTKSTNPGAAKAFVTGSSIVHQQVGAIDQIIVAVWRDDLMGVDSKTGKTLWHWRFEKATSAGMCATPVVLGNRLLVSAAQGAANYVQCLEMIPTDNGGIQPKLVYENDRLMCNQYHTPSVLDGAAYGFGRGDNADALQCLDVATGKMLWQKEGADWRRDRQLTIADGLIFALTTKDELVLAEANKTAYKEIARLNPGVKLGIQQQPVISNHRLYLRGDDILVCYQVGPLPE